MDKEKEITEYLKLKYNPVVILLHGSRAVGKNRPHSDWDIIMLFDSDVPRKGFREEVDGEDVEWKAFQLPIPDEKIIEIFDVYLQFAKILSERDSIGTNLLQKAILKYNEGPNLSAEIIKREKQFFEHKILGMKDDEGTPYMFLRHLSVLFNRASNLWFEILHNEFPKPFYLAVPIIQDKDPEYYRHLMALCSDNSSNEKIASAHWIAGKLFKI
ncbi:MAG: nucleotidyltransferase domain-containing protein [Patescibacteria group bacterium]